ncbi:hypothetical protein [Nocardiopsis lucentensis]|uniref:hypothetical protein n=1 Tax=Nocardiopsis lucentensis TaxID=53441 RepID=UPI001267C5A7|nr:hypothetical protein [Nocardiopsis lucentensis]
MTFVTWPPSRTSIPPDRPAEISPSKTAPMCAPLVRSWSHPSRVPLSIWIRWMMLSMLAKICEMTRWLGTVSRNQARMRRMARLRIALKMGIHFREAPNVQ